MTRISPSANSLRKTFIMKKYIIYYGIAGGLISSLLGTLNWLIIARPLGVTTSQTVGYISIAISLLCIPFGVRYFREKHNDGRVSLSEALKIGVAITTVAGVVMAIHSMIFFALQKDAFISWQQANLSADELQSYNEQLATMPDFAFTPWFQAIVMFIMVFLIGAVINIVSALMLRKT